jgi:hypothetical protein
MSLLETSTHIPFFTTVFTTRTCSSSFLLSLSEMILFIYLLVYSVPSFLAGRLSYNMTFVWPVPNFLPLPKISNLCLINTS